MRDAEGPTVTGAFFGILLLLLAFTVIELSGRDSRSKTIYQLCGACLMVWGALSWYEIHGLKQALIGFPAAYLIHSITFGLWVLREASPPYNGPL